MKENPNAVENILRIDKYYEGDGWFIHTDCHNCYRKNGARVYIRMRKEGMELYINDTGEYGPYRIPTRLLDEMCGIS